MVLLKAADRIEVMRPYLGRAAETGRSQVAAIGVAQEAQRVFIARKRDTDPSKPPHFLDKKDRRVTVYYFYLWDASFGPAFIKVCTYCPWPVKIWVNGHEWAKQQARKAGLPFTELSNGFASCQDPDLLQRICDVLQPGTISVFFQRWLHRLPLPLAPPISRRATGGSAHGPGRGLPHHRVHPAALRPAFFDALSPTTWTSAARTLLRSSSTGRSVQHRRRVPDQCDHPRHRGHHQRLLQALAH